jgi:hypothetical protein
MLKLSGIEVVKAYGLKVVIEFDVELDMER